MAFIKRSVVEQISIIKEDDFKKEKEESEKDHSKDILSEKEDKDSEQLKN